MSWNSSLNFHFPPYNEDDYKYPDGHVSRYSKLGLPGNKRRSQKWSSVGNYPKWKEYGPTQKSAIKAIDEEIAKLLGDNKVLNKFKNKWGNVIWDISSLDKKISILQNTRRQALDAVSYIAYASEQIIPKVKNYSHDAKYDEDNFN